MKPIIQIMCTTILSAGLLQGCATAVVGGATAGISAAHDRRSIGTSIDDQTIELKLLSNYVSDKQLTENSHIAATSYNYVVLLTGQAANEDIRRRAVDTAQGMPLVKRVVNEIQLAPKATLAQQSQDTWLTSKAKVELFNIKIEGFDPTRVKVISELGVVYLMGLVTPQEADATVDKIRYLTGVKQVVKVFDYL